jgi:hypothetical protein
LRSAPPIATSSLIVHVLSVPVLSALSPELSMRAETQSIVDEIKQSVGLLRRHL